MEILVLDLETTGLHTTYASVVEVGLALVNTKTKKIKKVFDKVVREKNFNPNYDCWIFNNSDLTPTDVMKAKTLDHYRPKIQALLDKYPVTAFNKGFDLRMFRARGFVCNDVECLMKSTKKYFKVKKNNRVKSPSVQEAYDIFFPKSDYIETHRGGDDAMHEAELLLAMCEMKIKKTKIKEILL